MKIGFYGGSFDPFHLGHLSIINGALKEVDVIVVIPVSLSSFKKGKSASASPYRYYMTEDVIKTLDSRIIISDIELKDSGISYTINTLRKFINDGFITELLHKSGFSSVSNKEKHDYYYIVGSDILPSFDKWYCPDEILSMVTLLVAKRPDDNVNIDDEKNRLHSLFERLTLKAFDIDGVNVSSSSLREDLSEDLLPEPVMDFLNLHKPYEYGECIKRLNEETYLEFLNYATRLYEILGRKRLLHSLNVALLSMKLAFIHGADPNKALIAGELHDVAKELNKEELISYAKSVSGDEFLSSSKLLHAPAGAFVAKKDFGIDDEEILDAIIYHTTGKSGMSKLGKIIYLSDKIEPSRNYDDLTDIREASLVSLDKAVGLCVKAVRSKMSNEGQKVHHLTNELLDELMI